MTNIAYEGETLTKAWKEFIKEKNELIELELKKARIKLPSEEIKNFKEFIKNAILLSYHHKISVEENETVYLFKLNGQIFQIKDVSGFFKRIIFSPYKPTLNLCLIKLFDFFQLDLKANFYF